MNITKISTITAALTASLLLCGPRLSAQDTTTAATPAPTAAPATTNPGGGPGGGGQNWQQRIADRIKTNLKATDDEWAVIQPLLQKVIDLRMAGRGGGFGGGRRGGGPGGPGGNNGGGNPPPAPTGPGAAEAQALSTALDSDSTSNDEIKAKLAALREARKKNAADLEAARTNLEKVLTLRQEAVLVNMGILE